MKKLFLALFLGIFVLASCDKKVETKEAFNIDSVKNDIEAWNVTFEEIVKNKDSVGFANLFSEDAVRMAPNVTMQQYVSHFKNQLKPVLEKEFQCKVIMVESVRGKNAKQVGFIWLFASDAARNKVYKAENVMTEFGEKAMKNAQPAIDAWNKLGTIGSDYTDWVVL